MVLVTTNDNGGEGLQVQKNGENIDLILEPGDMVIFDNTKILHGVPNSTPNNRNMVGFRNFEIFPLYFSKQKFEGSTEYKNGFIAGYTKELSPKQAVNELKKRGISYA